MGKLIERIPGPRVLISILPGSALRMLVEWLGKPRNVKSSILKALSGKLDTKRHLVFSIVKIDKYAPNIQMAVLPKVRSALCVASQLPGEGPTDVEEAPTPAC